MSDQASKGREQAEYWKASGSQGWTAVQDLVDRTFRPFEELLVQVVAGRPNARVLDIGCGTGGTTVAVARALGAGGQCTGVDISEGMVDAARARAERANVAATFVVGDAQSHAFAPESYDAVISRFGVMFFEDPVRAFTNIRRATAPGATLTCIAWRGPAENPFMTAAERAVAPIVPDLPVRQPNEPGQFGFADGERVRGILASSGWSSIDVRAIDVTCAMPKSELRSWLTQLGPVARKLREADEALRARILDAVLPAFEPYVRGDDIHFPAACWSIGARA